MPLITSMGDRHRERRGATGLAWGNSTASFPSHRHADVSKHVCRTGSAG